MVSIISKYEMMMMMSVFMFSLKSDFHEHKDWLELVSETLSSVTAVLHSFLFICNDLLLFHL